ncbi:MAG: UDP-N-acetylmuramate dehydrogenase [Desulfoarculaceae bacterium]|nr:UDP-N-acetylmuramate dehydrogenase [Desulfoarculaceae bacterium]
MGMDAGLKEGLAALAGSPVSWDCPLRDYTSFAIGGPAVALITVQDLAELQGLLLFFVEHKIKWRIIGRGTNLLVSDAGFDGVILLLGKGLGDLCRVNGGENDGPVVQAGAGCSLTRLVSWCLDQGLSGLEFVAGIPGTIGGAVIMNAGAWGHELSEVLVSVTVVTSSGQICTLPRTELDFGYRIWHDPYRSQGVGAGTEWVVVAVGLQCVAADQGQIRTLCQSYRQKRQEKQPKGEPNAGSFFKNPAGDAAGRLIEASGLKGLRVGGAMVSPVHANFLVNSGGATAADVLELMVKVRGKVHEDSGILLEPEVHLL